MDRRASGDVEGCLQLVSNEIVMESGKDGTFRGVEEFKSGLTIALNAFGFD
jgi:hypothetical protein